MILETPSFKHRDNPNDAIRTEDVMVKMNQVMSDIMIPLVSLLSSEVSGDRSRYIVMITVGADQSHVSI